MTFTKIENGQDSFVWLQAHADSRRACFSTADLLWMELVMMIKFNGMKQLQVSWKPWCELIVCSSCSFCGSMSMMRSRVYTRVVRCSTSLCMAALWLRHLSSHLLRTRNERQTISLTYPLQKLTVVQRRRICDSVQRFTQLIWSIPRVDTIKRLLSFRF